MNSKNRYAKKIKMERQQKRLKFKKFKLLGYLGYLPLIAIVLLVVGLPIGLCLKSLSIAGGYYLQLMGVIIGIYGISELIGLRAKPDKVILNFLKSIACIAIGLFTIPMFIRLSLDIPKFVLFDTYKTETVYVHEINSKRGFDEVVSDAATYTFFFKIIPTPDNQHLEIDYLPRSKVGIRYRETD